MIDIDSITIDQFRERAIAIDTEYHLDPSGAIDRVYCVCASVADGRKFKVWIEPETDDSIGSLGLQIQGQIHRLEGLPTCDNPSTLLCTIAQNFGIKEPIFLAHAYDLAERQAFLFLGDDPYRYDWFCTFHGALILKNAFAFRADSSGLSYAGACKELLGISIDTARKEEMRSLCIEAKTQGHESEIMDYCLDDTSHLIPLALEEVRRYGILLKNSLRIHKPTISKNPLGLLLYQCQSYNIFGKISAYGFPVDPKRLSVIASKSKVLRNRLLKEFVERYPDSFVYTPPKKELCRAILEKWIDPDSFDPNSVDAMDDLKHALDGVDAKERRRAMAALNWLKNPKDDPNEGWHRNNEVCYAFIEDDVSRLGLDHYPRTSTGKPKMDSDTLKDCFKGTDGFGDHLRKLTKKLDSLEGASGRWAKTLDSEGCVLRYRSLRPFASATGRCQGKPGDGFVLGWAHYLYGILNPPKGKWLVELDFSSEETGIQAILCKDKAYATAYTQKDIYCWIGVCLGIIPKEDYLSLSKDALKERYHAARSKLKTFFLAWGYGCGIETLSARVGISKSQAKAFKDHLELDLFEPSTTWKKEFSVIARNRFMGVVLPDGWLCRTKLGKGETPKTVNSLRNFPFQGYGAYILRELARKLVEIQTITPVATMHDAVMFMVDEGDLDSIQMVKRLMEDTANACLGSDRFIRVGEPDIAKHGEIWCPDPEDVEEFKELMNTPSELDLELERFDRECERNLDNLDDLDGLTFDFDPTPIEFGDFPIDQELLAQL